MMYWLCGDNLAGEHDIWSDRRDFLPNTIWNGEMPGAERRLCRIVSPGASKSSHVALVRLRFNSRVNVRCCPSHNPFACGWPGVVRICLLSHAVVTAEFKYRVRITFYWFLLCRKFRPFYDHVTWHRTRLDGSRIRIMNFYNRMHVDNTMLDDKTKILGKNIGFSIKAIMQLL